MGARAQLRAIWRQRLAGDVAQSDFAFTAFVQGLGLERPVSHRDVLAPQLRVDLLLLEASFARRALRLDAAEALCDGFSPHEAAGERRGAIALQRGLNALTRGDRAKALALFSAAQAASDDPIARATAGFNRLLCEEDLGMDIRASLPAVEALLAHKSVRAATAIFAGQLSALRARRAFRSADVPALRAEIGRGLFADQATYYLAWIKELPTLSVETAPDFCARAQTYLTEACAHGFETPYVLRTLLGMQSEGDVAASRRMTERVERLYLWVWRWLLRPDAKGYRKCLQVMKQLRSVTADALTAEDAQMLTISCRWLGLFARIDDEAAQWSLAGVHHGDGRSPILDFEALLQDFLVARRATDQARARAALDALRRHRLARADGFVLPKLVESIANPASPAPPQFAALSAALRSLGATVDTDQPGLVVDALSDDVFVCAGDGTYQKTRSAVFAATLSAVQRMRVIDLDQLMAKVYGLAAYDDGAHRNKVAKLLWDFNRQLAPFAKASRRETRVIVEIADDHLRIVNDGAHFRVAALDRHLLHGVIYGDDQSLGDIDKGWLTRGEMQAELGLGRTAVLARLGEWIESGAVARRGRGRSVKYKVLNPQAVARN